MLRSAMILAAKKAGRPTPTDALLNKYLKAPRGKSGHATAHVVAAAPSEKALAKMLTASVEAATREHEMQDLLVDQARTSTDQALTAMLSSKPTKPAKAKPATKAPQPAIDGTLSVLPSLEALLKAAAPVAASSPSSPSSPSSTTDEELQALLAESSKVAASVKSPPSGPAAESSLPSIDDVLSTVLAPSALVVSAKRTAGHGAVSTGEASGTTPLLNRPGTVLLREEGLAGILLDAMPPAPYTTTFGGVVTAQEDQLGSEVAVGSRVLCDLKINPLHARLSDTRQLMAVNVRKIVMNRATAKLATRGKKQ
jgi:hypothetical protein